MAFCRTAGVGFKSNSALYLYRFVLFQLLKVARSAASAK